MIRLALFCLSACLLALPISAAKKRFDERGNLLPDTAPVSATTATVPAAKPEQGSDAALNPTFAPAAASDTSATSSSATAPAVSASESPLSEAAREEAEALAAQKNGMTKVYLENAHMYLRSNRNDKALEFLKKSQEAGDDEFSREARLLALWLRARRGDQGLEGEAEGMDEKLRVEALLRTADGYATCAKEQLKKPECLNEAERIYAYISELQPRSTTGKLARLRLGLLLVDAGRLEAALPHLTRTLMAEGVDFKTGQNLREIPLDRAWYNLGQLYERPWYHRDTHKAEAAYKQVLKYAASPYQQAARERLQSLRHFGTGYARP